MCAHLSVWTLRSAPPRPITPRPAKPYPNLPFPGQRTGCSQTEWPAGVPSLRVECLHSSLLSVSFSDCVACGSLVLFCVWLRAAPLLYPCPATCACMFAFQFLLFCCVCCSVPQLLCCLWFRCRFIVDSPCVVSVVLLVLSVLCRLWFIPSIDSGV